MGLVHALCIFKIALPTYSVILRFHVSLIFITIDLAKVKLGVLSFVSPPLCSIIVKRNLTLINLIYVNLTSVKLSSVSLT